MFRANMDGKPRAYLQPIRTSLKSQVKSNMNKRACVKKLMRVENATEVCQELASIGPSLCQHQ